MVAPVECLCHVCGQWHEVPDARSGDPKTMGCWQVRRVPRYADDERPEAKTLRPPKQNACPFCNTRTLDDTGKPISGVQCECTSSAPTFTVRDLIEPL